jgi:hypothetical protein
MKSMLFWVVILCSSERELDVLEEHTASMLRAWLTL